MRVFVDSDVVISSLLSCSGAAYLLLDTQTLNLYISLLSQNELEIVVKRLGIERDRLNELIQSKLHVIPLPQSLTNIKEFYKDYVLDMDDAHIVAGAKASEAKFLVTYNIKDFKAGKIKEDFNIIILTPGQFLQYLRSIK